MWVPYPRTATISRFRPSLPFLSLPVLTLGKILRRMRRGQNDGIPPVRAAGLDAEVRFASGFVTLQVRWTIPRAETHQEIL
jgi:hypothetical protein